MANETPLALFPAFKNGKGPKWVVYRRGQMTLVKIIRTGDSFGDREGLTLTDFMALMKRWKEVTLAMRSHGGLTPAEWNRMKSGQETEEGE